MSFDVEQFISRVGPPIRSNRYELTIDQFPPALSNSEYAPVWSNLRFHVEAVDTPTVALVTQDTRRYGYGPIERRPISPGYGPVRLVVIGDQDGMAFGFFRAWQACAVNYEFSTSINQSTGYQGMGVYEVGYKGDYAVQVSIATFSEDGAVAETTILREAYPSSIASTPLAWAQNNSHVQLPVELTFFDCRTIRGPLVG